MGVQDSIKDSTNKRKYLCRVEAGMHVWPSGRSEVSARGRWSATNVWFKSARLSASGVGGQAISKEFYLFFTLDLTES